jgi:hypothetical protein
MLRFLQLSWCLALTGVTSLQAVRPFHQKANFQQPEKFALLVKLQNRKAWTEPKASTEATGRMQCKKCLQGGVEALAERS